MIHACALLFLSGPDQGFALLEGSVSCHSCLHVVQLLGQTTDKLIVNLFVLACNLIDKYCCDSCRQKLLLVLAAVLLKTTGSAS